mmetsp:Transcript_91455/g.238304  ORF Transcript_91455/g.238304 Transcript_91455/m.238304 type:complete len:222 (+) Transcript_91455:708-1373(+)
MQWHRPALMQWHRPALILARPSISVAQVPLQGAPSRTVPITAGRISRTLMSTAKKTVARRARISQAARSAFSWTGAASSRAPRSRTGWQKRAAPRASWRPRARRAASRSPRALAHLMVIRRRATPPSLLPWRHPVMRLRRPRRHRPRLPRPRPRRPRTTSTRRTWPCTTATTRAARRRGSRARGSSAARTRRRAAMPRAACRARAPRWAAWAWRRAPAARG